MLIWGSLVSAIDEIERLSGTNYSPTSPEPDTRIEDTGQDEAQENESGDALEEVARDGEDKQGERFTWASGELTNINLV